MSDGLSFESLSARSTGPRQRLMIGSIKRSSVVRLSFIVRCFGPDASAVRNGRLRSVSRTFESSIFAFSAASRMRCTAILSLRTSMPDSFLNSVAMWSIKALSISVPPNWVSPLVDFTSKTPCAMSMMVTSSVPPPRSNTRIFCSLPVLSSP